MAPASLLLGENAAVAKELIKAGYTILLQHRNQIPFFKKENINFELFSNEKKIDLLFADFKTIRKNNVNEFNLIREFSFKFESVNVFVCENDLDVFLKSNKTSTLSSRRALASKAFGVLSNLSLDSSISSSLNKYKTILVLGNGGREHAIVNELLKSKKIEEIIVFPGNGGTATIGKNKNEIIVRNINSLNNEPSGSYANISNDNFSLLVSFCKSNNINFVVVGPEEPLVNGITDILSNNGIECFGPSRESAKLEGSKIFSKDFMKRNNIKTAEFNSFYDSEKAIQYLSQHKDKKFVVKASGLCAGKGVIMCETFEESVKAVKDILDDNVFKVNNPHSEWLIGQELSLLAFSDGDNVLLMPPAQDHKRALDGDKGLNTGGMGCFAPITALPPLYFGGNEGEKSFSGLMEECKAIVQKTVDGMKAEGRVYKGVIYTGFMITENGPYVLEYNCRFGDPETQVLLPLLNCNNKDEPIDLLDIFAACVSGDLRAFSHVFPEFNHFSGSNSDLKAKAFACTVVCASGGYPLEYKKNLAISGLESARAIDGITVFHAGSTLSDADNKLYTSGGRVLSVSAVDSSLSLAVSKAYRAVAEINFEDKHFRTDIASKAASRETAVPVAGEVLTYKTAGVDIDAGEALVELIKPYCKKTRRPGCDAELGGFGGLFDLGLAGFSDRLPRSDGLAAALSEGTTEADKDGVVLVAGTDGVGTKLKIAQSVGVHDTIGIDLVAMCVNDVLVCGAEPLFFLDYYATGHLNVTEAASVVKGIAEGCVQSGSALIGGETAEMAGMYSDGEYDLAGFSVGAVRRNLILPRDIGATDRLIGLRSSGVHSNGYSLVRKCVEKSGLKWTDKAPFVENLTLGEALLTPTRIYVKTLMPLIKRGLVKGMAHITGGGLLDNLPRILEKDQAAFVDATSAQWNLPPVFKWLQSIANLPQDELLRTFNCGIGMVVVVGDKDFDEVMKCLIESEGKDFPPYVLGSIQKRESNNSAQVVVHGEVS